LRRGEGLLRGVLEFAVPGDAGIRMDAIGRRPLQLPADAADQRIHRLVGISQRARQRGVGFGVAGDLDALREHGQHRAVAQRAALAEVPAHAGAHAQVAAVGRAAVDAGDRAELHFAVDVVADLRVAHLAVDPQGARAPAGIAAQGRVALVEAAAAQAPVHLLLAVTGKGAIDEVAAGLLDTDGQGRADAVVIA